ncbi:MAG TPA: cation transporter dimerization domain-containing protein [Casimicrobiaceae bacterium]
MPTILDRYRSEGIDYHALRTRQAGGRRFIDLHVLVPGAWTVQRKHDVVESIEAQIREELPNATVLVQLEPIEDTVSRADIELDRSQ